MAAIDKKVLYEQMNTHRLQVDMAISEYVADKNVKESLLRFVEWLKAKGVSPLYVDCEGQSPLWEIGYNDKTYYIVLNGVDNICVMVKVAFTDEYQAVMGENNLQDIVLSNLQYCTRKDGGHCGGCHLPSDVAGVEETIFGKEIKNLCCGQFISFDNPSSETIEGIKKLLKL